MNKVQIKMTPIAQRWLRNHCENVNYVADDGSGDTIQLPKVIEKVPITLRNSDIELSLNRYKMRNQNDDTEYYVRQYIQHTEVSNGVVLVKVGLKFESDNRRVICSNWDYIPSYNKEK